MGPLLETLLQLEKRVKIKNGVYVRVCVNADSMFYTYMMIANANQWNNDCFVTFKKAPEVFVNNDSTHAAIQI